MAVDPNQDQQVWPNIVLGYKLIVQFALGEDSVTYYCPHGAEFFIDEHDLQWVKFKPMNGYKRGNEHIIRTDAIGFMIIKDDVG